MAVFNNDLVYRGGGEFTKLPTSPDMKAKYTPMPWQERTRQRMDHAFNMFNIIRDRGDFSVDADPEFDYAKKAERMATEAYKLRMQAAAQRAANRNIAVANSPVFIPGINGGTVPKGKFGRFIQAISGQESGGNYGAVNSDSGALGKYQIMPSNLAGPGGWDQEALGRNISTQDFLSSPKLQEAIARYKLRQYYNQYGPAGAASAWYSGDPNKWNSRTPQGNYPSIHAYVQAILRAMGIG